MIQKFWNVLFVLVFGLGGISAVSAATDDSFASLVEQLGSSNLREKAKVISQIAALEDERALPVLEALMNNALYQRKSDKRTVFVTDENKQLRLTDVVSEEDLGLVDSRDVRKV